MAPVSAWVSRVCFWRREPTFEVRPGDCVPAQLPGSRTRQRRDRGASHHGELAAQRPRTPDPGLGQEAPARGTHLGRAAKARGGEGGRGSRHVASPYFLLLSLTRGWGRGSEEPRKTFFQVPFGVAKLFVTGLRWLPAVGSQSVGRSVFRGTALGGDPFLLAGKVEQPPVLLWSHCPEVDRRYVGAGAGRLRRLCPCAPLPPAGTGAGCVPLPLRGAASRPASTAVPRAISMLAGAQAAQRPVGAPGRTNTWRWAGGCERK